MPLASANDRYSQKQVGFSRGLVPRLAGIARAIVAVCLIAFAQGCLHLDPRFQEPSVSIESLELLEQRGLSQRFRIGLRLSNPNSRALPIIGMSYTLSLNGYNLINGVSNQVPELAPYAETQVFLEAGADLFEALRLLQSLASKPGDKLEYTLAAKLDLEGMLPTLNIQRRGTVELLGGD